MESRFAAWWHALCLVFLGLLAVDVNGQAPAAFTVKFDRTSYAVPVNSTLTASVVIDPVPASKLFSYGLLVQITGSNGIVGVASLTPVAAYNQNGPNGAGALAGAAVGTAGVKGTADFFSDDLPTLAGGVIATLNLQGLPVGSYTITLFPYQTLGPAEQIFVNGDLSVSDPVITYGSASLTVADVPGQIDLSTGVNLDRQSGLFIQTVRITNNTTRTPSGIRLWVDGLPPEVTVWNKHGLVADRPYLDYTPALPPGQFVDLQVEFYSTTRQPFPAPAYSVQEINPPVITPPTGTTQGIVPRLALANGNCLLEFSTKLGTTYYIQYSSDLITWKTALPSVMGNGTTVQWIDNGPPRTEAKPTQALSRFYRLVEAVP
ncbi:MAG: hypothetical protein IPK22_19040 [Verrucomicrobiaceae bacterium]|nr:hypothetical protein [Verrucomicrobiaceae bacterium]